MNSHSLWTDHQRKEKTPEIIMKGDERLFIIIRKATSVFFRIRITDEKNNIVLLRDTDKLFFTVKKNPDNEMEQPIIRRVLTAEDELEGCYGFELTPADTDKPAGTYYYDAGVQRENGELYRIITPDQFLIKQSVTRKDD